MKKLLLLWIAILANFSVFRTTAQTIPFHYKAGLPKGESTINDANQDIINTLGKMPNVIMLDNSIASKGRGGLKRFEIDNTVLENDRIVITTRFKTYDLNIKNSSNKDFEIDEFPYQKGSGKIGQFYETFINFDNGTWFQIGGYDKDLMCRLVDDFYFIKTLTASEANDKELARFNSVVEKNKELAAKPQLSEEQRKYIVQANAATQTKDFDQAIAYYQQVLQVSETSYPEAYFNLALLYGHENLFDKAILNMKKYLLLKPDARDARAAQDKIYEWEAGINK